EGQDGARGDDDVKRPEAALVDWVERSGEALDEEPTGADRDGVAAIEWSRDLRTGAREVARHRAVCNSDRNLQTDRPIQTDAVVVGMAHSPVDAGGDPSERGARAAFRLLHVDPRGLQHGIASVAREDLAEVRLAGPAHREHRLHVLERAALHTDVPADDAQHLFVQVALAHQAHGLKAQTLLP